MKIAPSSQMIFEEAQRQGYTPRWLTDYGIFVIKKNGRDIPVYMTYSQQNSQLLSRLTRDKYACRRWLDQHGFENIPYCFTTQRREVHRFFDQHGVVVAKPVLGERGKGVVLVKELQKLDQLDLRQTILEKYIVGEEYRVLLLQGEVVGVQKKILDPQPHYSWRKQRIGLEKTEWPKELVVQSKQIHEVVPQAILAVDWLVDEKEKAYVLELNSAPGLWSFAHPHAGVAQDFSRPVLDILLSS